MPPAPPLIIANAARSPAAPRRASLSRRVGFAACLLGAVAAVVYWRAGLTLSHYDAKAHLVVARRIFDSLTPGWRQIGAVWLPLPHLLNALPVQIDACYRTGASAVLISIAAFALGAGAAAALVQRLTGCTAAAVAAAALLVLNPNTLYLQSTPLTEPLLIGLSLAAVDGIARWMGTGHPGPPWRGGLALAGACLTRYEAWALAAALVGAVAFAARRDGHPLRTAMRRAALLAPFPGTAIAAFLLLSRLTVGEWLVTGGFFVAENPAAGRPLLVARQIGGGLQMLLGHPAAWSALAAALGLLFITVRRRPARSAALVLALWAVAALPAYAFFTGHPFRIRYMIPLVSAAAVTTGVGLGLLPRGRALASALVVSLSVLARPPFSSSAAMIQEAQWDADDSRARRTVTAYLARHYRGERILASMGALAHYMQETSAAGFALREFIHEGNDPIWSAALAAPARHAGWVLLRESDREGRDAVAAAARRNPRLLNGFARVLEAGTVSIYRRGGG